MSIIIAEVIEKGINAICDGYRFKGEAITNNNIAKIIKINEDTIAGGVGFSCLLDIFKDYCLDKSSELIADNINRDFLLKFINQFVQKISTEYDKMKINESDLILITRNGIFSYTVYEDMKFTPIEHDGCTKLAIGIGSDYANSLLDIDIDIETIMKKCIEKYPSLGGKITKINL